MFATDQKTLTYLHAYLSDRASVFFPQGDVSRSPSCMSRGPFLNLQSGGALPFRGGGV